MKLDIHFLNYGSSKDESKEKFVRFIIDKILLDAYECPERIKSDNLMNTDRDSISFSCLNSFLK